MIKIFKFYEIVSLKFPQSVLVLPHSSIYLIKWSRVNKTAIPYLIYNLDRLHIILAERAHLDRQSCSSSNTILEMTSKLGLGIREELPHPSTFTTQCACADLMRQLIDAKRTNLC